MITRRQFLQRSATATASAALAPLSQGCANGATIRDYSATIATLKPYVAQQMTVVDAPVAGLAVVLVDDQRTVWAEGFGYADLGARHPVTPDTVFEIGSNSKVFTGTMVMRLYERGLLDIDAPLATYLRQFSIAGPLGSFASTGAGVTPRTMMTHHSGLPCDLINGAFTMNAPSADFNARMIAYMRGEYAAYPANFVYAYSNTAVMLLADVIAAASGQTFEQYSNQLFATLGMTNSTFYPDNTVVAPNRSKGYIGTQDYGPYYCNIMTAGSIVSSVLDMAKFLKMVMAQGNAENGTVLRPETLGLMLTPANISVPLDLDFSIGLAWMLSDPLLTYAGKLCFHAGGTLTMASHMEILRDHKLAAMVLTNTMTGASAAENIVRRALQLALQEKTGITPPLPAVRAVSPTVAWSAGQLDSVAGLYVTNQYTGYDRVARSGAGLPHRRRLTRR